uniref:DNA helicase Pif1-like 2B domain-containing protein n=1 Tax=Octopus bimaculoides TaxID=37653 RepID=A0A0L8GSS3_OCTBM
MPTLHGDFWIQRINMIMHSKMPLCDVLRTSFDTFSVTLLFCNLTDAHSLWNKYKGTMCHDILLQARQTTGNVDALTTPAIYNRGLLLLEDLVKAIGGQRLDTYSPNTPDRNEDPCPNRLILRETSYNIHKLKQHSPDNATLLNSDQAEKQFTINMRSLLQTGQATTQFSEMLLKIGNGQTTSDDNGYIDTTTIGHTVSSPDDLCSAVYPNLTTEYIEPRLALRQSCSCTYKCSFTHFPTEFLNSQDPPGLPTHEFHLNVGYLFILLRNLNAPTLNAQIITGHGKNETVFILKILLTQTDCPYPMQRLQFPLKFSFAMTINKAKGQSLKVIVLNLRTSYFSHGQLYVACTRVQTTYSSMLLKEKQKVSSTKHPYSGYFSTAFFTSTPNCSR